ncbi:hypothetical protein [Anaeromassilibacillus sp. SJQ-1]|uniref:hypothetical protein n=1 Tax=Anaeromassilibacillus sp. SJQ-1 TaxID=3375419 RepID=UPI001DE42CDF|nr:hypothetical protein [Clostridiales bacterium]
MKRKHCRSDFTTASPDGSRFDKMFTEMGSNGPSTRAMREHLLQLAVWRRVCYNTFYLKAGCYCPKGG